MTRRERKPDMPVGLRIATHMAMQWHEVTEEVIYGKRVVPWDQVPAYLRGVMVAGFEEMINRGYVLPQRFWNDGGARGDLAHEGSGIVGRAR